MARGEEDWVPEETELAVEEGWAPVVAGTVVVGLPDPEV